MNQIKLEPDPTLAYLSVSHFEKLKHELALARASSDYWRSKFIKAYEDSYAKRLDDIASLPMRRVYPRQQGKTDAIAQFQKLIQTEPVDLENAWDRYTCE